MFLYVFWPNIRTFPVGTHLHPVKRNLAERRVPNCPPPPAPPHAHPSTPTPAVSLSGLPFDVTIVAGSHQVPRHVRLVPRTCTYRRVPKPLFLPVKYIQVRISGAKVGGVQCCVDKTVRHFVMSHQTAHLSHFPKNMCHLSA